MDATQEWEIYRDAEISRRKRKFRREFRKFREVMLLTSLPFWCIVILGIFLSFTD